ncbi:MAG TPA: 16S rRNA (cytosine(967)-C(5))-methyltransferase RsmB [Vicinamibacterales bacterium]|nr:16S rRNA (cytosine(967)-C(5))-methyltransferase RsmB [Vicinamibacterales bacterium]
MIAPARLAAFEVLRVVGSGRSDLGSALARARTRLTDERDRALASEIATGTLRWQGAFDHIIVAFANRPLRQLDPEVLDILRLTIFQLVHLDRIPASAAVKDAVDLAGKAGKRSASGLVNAVLRRVSRERERLPLPGPPQDPADREAAIAYLSTTLSHPPWLVERWLDRYGFENTQAWARFNNAPAPLTLRVNRLKVAPAELIAALASHGVEVEPARHAVDALVVRSGNPLATPPDAQGLFVLQDEASQLVGAFAGARPGERVLDACASPGGKTTAMASAMGDRGLLVAADVRGRRLDLLVRAVRRSGASSVRVVQADVTAPLPFGPVFDRVLLDAPCSGLGTLRRDPDIKWRRSAADLPALALTQAAMLERTSTALAPSGTLVYSTCSSEPEENDGVIEAFLRAHPEFHMAREPLRTLPHRDGLEAFFAAMLVRTKDLR